MNNWKAQIICVNTAWRLVLVLHCSSGGHPLSEVTQAGHGAGGARLCQGEAEYGRPEHQFHDTIEQHGGTWRFQQVVSLQTNNQCKYLKYFYEEQDWFEVNTLFAKIFPRD